MTARVGCTMVGVVTDIETQIWRAAYESTDTSKKDPAEQAAYAVTAYRTFCVTFPRQELVNALRAVLTSATTLGTLQSLLAGKPAQVWELTLNDVFGDKLANHAVIAQLPPGFPHVISVDGVKWVWTGKLGADRKTGQVSAEYGDAGTRYWRDADGTITKD